jgi:lipopolysaccharide export system protein LptC
VRFEGNVVMNLDNLGEPAAPEPVAPPPKTRSVSGKSSNTK